MQICKKNFLITMQLNRIAIRKSGWNNKKRAFESASSINAMFITTLISGSKKSKYLFSFFYNKKHFVLSLYFWKPTFFIFYPWLFPCLLLFYCCVNCPIFLTLHWIACNKRRQQKWGEYFFTFTKNYLILEPTSW